MENFKLNKEKKGKKKNIHSHDVLKQIEKYMLMHIIFADSRFARDDVQEKFIIT